MTLIILILLAIIFTIILIKILKPYTIKYDTTLFLTGGLGSGKTLTAIKTATTLLRKARFNWWIRNVLILKIKNFFIVRHNKRVNKKGKGQLKAYICREPKPQIYSNIPINFKPHMWSSKKNREWTCKLEVEHLELLKEISQNSIVLIDELPQFVNQFNWDLDEVQDNINEFITLFRHYYGGYLISTAQSIDDVVAQIRRKGNQAIWCYNFHKHFFGLFYSVDMCDIMLNDRMTSYATSFIEDNTKKHYSLFPPKDTYDSRCYSERINNIYKKLEKGQPRWNKLKTNEILRIQDTTSPLDDKTTTIQKKAMQSRIDKRRK